MHLSSIDVQEMHNCSNSNDNEGTKYVRGNQYQVVTTSLEEYPKAQYMFQNCLYSAKKWIMV